MEWNVSQCDMRDKVIRQTISPQLYIRYLKVRPLGRNATSVWKKNEFVPASHSDLPSYQLCSQIKSGHFVRSFLSTCYWKEKVYHNPEAQWEICKMRSSSPFKLANSRTEASDEHKAEHKWLLHEPFQIWKQLYWYLFFIQTILVPL